MGGRIDFAFTFKNLQNPWFNCFLCYRLLSLLIHNSRLDKTRWINEVAGSLKVLVFGIFYGWEELSYESPLSSYFPLSLKRFLENLGFSQMQGFQVCMVIVCLGVYLHAMDSSSGSSCLLLSSHLHNTTLLVCVMWFAGWDSIDCCMEISKIIDSVMIYLKVG